jgi:hypothetical protein
VNHRVEAPERIRLLGDLPAFRDAGKIARDGVLGTGNRGQRFAGARRTARMEDDPMAFGGEPFCRELPEAIGCTGDEDARQDLSSDGESIPERPCPRSAVQPCRA